MKTSKWLLMMFAIISISSVVSAQQFYGCDGRYVKDGYDVLLVYPETDTQEVQDPVTSEYVWKTRKHVLYPACVNGEPIATYADVCKQAEQRRDRRPLEDYILNKLSKRLKVLRDGSYRIKMQNVVVNKDGEIVYYELDGIVGMKTDNSYGGEKELPATIKLPIDNEVRAIMNNAPSMKPAKICGTRVFYLADVYLSDFRIDMKNGQPTFIFRDVQPM